MIVCRHMPPAPGCQDVPCAVAQPGQFLPGLAAVRGTEQGGVFHTGIDGVRVGQRRLEMPDALEFPGVLRAVVPLVRAGYAFVGELVAHRFPVLPAVVRALDHLAEPAAGLGGIQPVRVDGRALEVIDLPAPQMGPADLPRLRLPSDVRMKAPLRVPTRTRTCLMPSSPLSYTSRMHNPCGYCGSLRSSVIRPAGGDDDPDQFAVTSSKS